MSTARDNIHRARNRGRNHDGNWGGSQGVAFLASSYVDETDSHANEEGTINYGITVHNKPVLFLSL